MLIRTHWFGLAAALDAGGIPCQAADITAIVGATVIHPDREGPSSFRFRTAR